MKNSVARRVALTGVLFALALALSVLESQVAPLMGLPPGVKLGLANIVVMYALIFLSARQAMLLVLLKAAFSLMVRGAVAGALSLCGGAFALCIMLLLRLAKKHPVGLLLLSVGGSLGHNIGQMLIVWLIFGGTSLYYAPILGISGIVMGFVTALSLRAVLPTLEKANLAKPK